MLPVEAETVARENRRRTLLIWAAIAVVIAASYYLWRLRSDPVEARQAFDAGERLMRAQRYDEAAIAFSQTIGLEPKFAEAYFLRGRAYANLFQWDKAIADFTVLVARLPNDPRGYLYRAQVHLEKKNLDRALQDATRAIERDPKLSPAYNLRGMVATSKRDTTAAMRDFNQSIELQPSADNLSQRGSLFMTLEQFEKAEEDFTAVIEFMPDAAHPYFARASARRALGKMEAAQTDHRMGRYLDGSR